MWTRSSSQCIGFVTVFVSTIFHGWVGSVGGASDGVRCVWCVSGCGCCGGGVLVVCVCVRGVRADFPCYSLFHTSARTSWSTTLDVNANLHKIFWKVFFTRVQRPHIAAWLEAWLDLYDCRGAPMKSRRTERFEAFKLSGHAQNLCRRGPRGGHRI